MDDRRGSVRDVRIEIELRLSLAVGVGALAEVTRILRESGGVLKAHLVFRVEDRLNALFVCEHPENGALALRERGFPVETDTVVTVLTQNAPGALSHLIRSLEAEQLEVVYMYSASAWNELFVVVRTTDNPKAEDLLKNFLLLIDTDAESSQ